VGRLASKNSITVTNKTLVLTGFIPVSLTCSSLCPHRDLYSLCGLFYFGELPMYGESLNWFQRFMQRFQPTPIEMAEAELKDAELAALHMEGKAEYAVLRVKIYNLTAEYHKGRIQRLKEFLHTTIGE
jgi:hypothetical protein